MADKEEWWEDNCKKGLESSMKEMKWVESTLSIHGVCSTISSNRLFQKHIQIETLHTT